MVKAMLAAAAVVVGLGATAGTAAAQQAGPYKVWYKSNDRRWDARIGQWVRYNTLNDQGVNPNNRAWYEAAAQRLTKNYQSQGYNVVFAVGGANTPPGGGSAPPPRVTVEYVVDVEIVYFGQVYRGYLGPYRSVAEAQQMYRNWAIGVQANRATIRKATLREVRR